VVPGAIWSTFYDVRRYGGLQILLRSLLGGGSMILSSQNEAPIAFLKRLGAVTHISGTPSHWRRALMTDAADAMSPRYVRLSGEIVDQSILDHLHRTYPNANLGHAYATTEVGVVFDVRDGKAGFPASYFDRAELRLDGGTLHVRSSRMAQSYIGAELPRGPDGFIDTGDLITQREERCYFAGRKEGVINVGGQKVYPQEVELIIGQHPDVRMVRVWGRRSAITGALVAADVVMRPGAIFKDIHNDLVKLCRRELVDWKVPVSIRQVDDIAITAGGKIARA
jgi:acyl-CoA synthetase (AMP-forming)/AMP-acid ligase II